MNNNKITYQVASPPPGVRGPIQFFAKHQKKAAATLAWIFYLQMVLPLGARAEGIRHRYQRIDIYGAGRSLPSPAMWKMISVPATVPENGMQSSISQMEGSTPIPLSQITNSSNTASTASKSRTGGPTQPEMQSFQSVNTNNMVDLFSGDFSYNIPLLDVGGYPVNMHYSSGIGMDQEASWVGLGWNINPGTITRNMRGLPDDFNGQETITKTQKVKDNKTTGASMGANAEIAGLNLSVFSNPKSGVSFGVFHNNYKGWGIENGISVGLNVASPVKGNLNAGLSLTNNSQEGLDISPSMSYSLASDDGRATGTASLSTNYNSRTGLHALQVSTGFYYESNKLYRSDGASIGGSIGTRFNSNISFAKPSFTPKIGMPFTSSNHAYTTKIGLEQYFYHPNFYGKFYQSIQKIEDEDTTKSIPAYGYLYYQLAQGKGDVLLDYNREKEAVFRDQTPHIAIPQYTYDTYTINGEGTGGMFRPYRGDIGFVYDNAMETKSKSLSASLDLGFGARLHVGTDFHKVNTKTSNNAWKDENMLKDVIGFNKLEDSVKERVYFKNPGEKTRVDQAFLDAIGGDDLVRADLSPASKDNSKWVNTVRSLSKFKNQLPNGNVLVPATLLRQQRDKRVQHISFLTAGQAAKRWLGLDTMIRSYGINQFPGVNCTGDFESVKRVDELYRKAHHLSELTVVNPDGKRYVYGLPVYNISQADVSFSSKQVNASSGLVDYADGNNSTKNTQGKDQYFNKEITPAYAHSFMLSGILSPDYSDVTGDGITEDDMGDAVKFNYSRVYGPDDPYEWKSPYDTRMATYNEGLKTDNRDQQASYSYGAREQWYLNSIESKTMIATFVLDEGTPRDDGHGVSGENGGYNSAKKQYRLKQINLYAKSDLIKFGTTAAKPIKAVHFEYAAANASLCPNTPGTLNGTGGKLTLTKVWFTYNKNNKGQLNPYSFKYHSNPSYNNKSYDRWGNYKDPANNPGGLNNADYPYVLQGNTAADSIRRNNDIAAWTLNEIKLPSGAIIKVSYESDDYAYVQNKRAMQFFKVAGFGATSTSPLSNKLYTVANKQVNFNKYAFVRIPIGVSSDRELTQRYMEGIKKFYFRTMVRMPDDRWGTGFENVPCYTEIKKWGIKGSPSDNLIWLEMGEVEIGGNDIIGKTPLAVAAIQFLRLNLPSKAYPNSEPGDNLTLKQVVGLLVSNADNINQTRQGFIRYATLGKGWCNLVDTNQSFVRLNNPYYKKYGGGLRVKRVEIDDYWDNMNTKRTNPVPQLKAIYGQEYIYTTTAQVNGQPAVISSGVATYEPVIGGEENPFRVPIEFIEKSGVLGPSDLLYTEEPIAESFFPSPSVGYSKVRVQTIHYDKKSANGFEESEYYTARDFPTIVEYTPLDRESKKRFESPWFNLFKINTNHFLTLSQGFKVELNDMHGKMKLQSSYAMTDEKNPLAYTKYFYRTEKELAMQERLSNTVITADSASGALTTNSQIGKEVELMVDFREQKTVVNAPSVEVNVDIASFVPPILTGSFFPNYSRETSRFRSVAITKVVNRYGILDSVVVMDKGSIVSTKNLVYDAETGEVLVSRTNNEFDDAIYNTTYPAHWAYSGLGPAYKNQGAVMTGAAIGFIKEGRAFKPDQSLYQGSTVFESGDELWMEGKFFDRYTDTCQGLVPDLTTLKSYSEQKIWVIDAGKGVYNHKGLYFIDKDGKPLNALVSKITVVRSGKRNMADNPVGSVTSLATPIRLVGGKNRIVIDSTIRIIAASAGQYRDRWKTENTLYAKDTVLKVYQDPKIVQTTIYPSQTITLRRLSREGAIGIPEGNGPEEVSVYHNDWGGVKKEADGKAFLLFDFSKIPVGAQVINSTLSLFAHTQDHVLFDYKGQRETHGLSFPHIPIPPPGSVTGQNRARINRTIGFPYRGSSTSVFEYHFKYHVNSNPVLFGPTPSGTTDYYNANAIPMGSLLQDMLNARVGSNGIIQNTQGIKIEMDIAATAFKRMCFSSVCANDRGYSYNQELVDVESSAVPTQSARYNKSFGNSCYTSPRLTVKWYKCPDTANAELVNGVYRCYSLKDTFICKYNINDTMVNPYRWGILGNWRMDRAYTYYGQRKQPDLAATTPVTNIRKDGEINNFMPYWALNMNGYMTPSADTMRWVWNSEMTLFNRKGYEIENRDPLDRYTAAQYGYNQTLPVAITQNSKNRQSGFEGFEDQDYKNELCSKCTPDRFFDLSTGGGSRVTTQAHTGKYSLKINANSTGAVSYPIVSAGVDSRKDSLLVKIDSSALIRTYVTGMGTGLEAQYYRPSTAVNPCNTINNEYPNITWYPLPSVSQIVVGCNNAARDATVIYQGYIQAPYNGDYIFGVQYLGLSVQVLIDDATVLLAGSSKQITTKDATVKVTMTAGQTKRIKIIYKHNNWLLGGNGSIKLLWKRTSLQVMGDPVPKELLYLPTATSAQWNLAKKNDTTWCIKLRKPTVKNLILPKFSPLQNTRILVHAWVKEDGPCLTGTYTNTQLVLLFNNSPATTITLKPKGKIIEGWQRIEDTLTIPATATLVTVQLKATGSQAVYFDDVRIHPYNANMKSFVYNPTNIRLMAELDENNYASFYEYDDDGTLIRVKKETERGVKTIRETRSALLKE